MTLSAALPGAWNRARRGLARYRHDAVFLAASALLGPTRARELQRRIGDLAQSRAGVVDAADAERRRIERDLHDGVQQRLVSLAVNLGLAQATLTGVPDDARQVIDDAHREAKDAMAELGDLVRGLHPAVLDDRGLDAALSGLVARVPLPVGLSVKMNERPSPTVESVAYFVISEALTNITKHARGPRGCDRRAERRCAAGDRRRRWQGRRGRFRRHWAGRAWPGAWPPSTASSRSAARRRAPPS